MTNLVRGMVIITTDSHTRIKIKCPIRIGDTPTRPDSDIKITNDHIAVNINNLTEVIIKILSHNPKFIIIRILLVNSRGMGINILIGLFKNPKFKAFKEDKWGLNTYLSSKDIVR